MDWTGAAAHELLQACSAAGRSGAWEEFMRRYHDVIVAAAVRVSRRWGTATSNEIDDVVQEIYLKLYADRKRILADFDSQHSDAAFGYIKVVATNAARDFFRLRGADKRGLGRTDSLADISQRLGLPADLDRQLTLAELHRIVAENTVHKHGLRDRAIFQFCYRDGMSALAISKLPGINLNPKGVEGVLYRLTKLIRAFVINKQETGAS